MRPSEGQVENLMGRPQHPMLSLTFEEHFATDYAELLIFQADLDGILKVMWRDCF